MGDHHCQGKKSISFFGHLVKIDFPEKCEIPVWKLEGGVSRPSSEKTKIIYFLGVYFPLKCLARKEVSLELGVLIMAQEVFEPGHGSKICIKQWICVPFILSGLFWHWTGHIHAIKCIMVAAFLSSAPWTYSLFPQHMPPRQKPKVLVLTGSWIPQKLFSTQKHRLSQSEWDK